MTDLEEKGTQSGAGSKRGSKKSKERETEMNLQIIASGSAWGWRRAGVEPVHGGPLAAFLRPGGHGGLTPDYLQNSRYAFQC